MSEYDLSIVNSAVRSTNSMLTVISKIFVSTRMHSITRAKISFMVGLVFLPRFFSLYYERLITAVQLFSCMCWRKLDDSKSFKHTAHLISQASSKTSFFRPESSNLSWFTVLACSFLTFSASWRPKIVLAWLNLIMRAYLDSR
jgi:hypothetical protein